MFFPGKNRRAFTLLEMVIIVVLMAVVAGTVLITGGIGTQHDLTLFDVAPRFKQVLWELRNRAMTAQKPMTLAYSWPDNEWHFAEEIQVELPKEVSFRLNGKEVIHNEGTLEITFSPQGRAEPVTFEMKSPGEYLIVEVSSLTGLADVRWYDAEEYDILRHKERKPIFGGNDDWL